MKHIDLTRDKQAIVDDSDYPFISQFNWHLMGKTNGHHYAQAFINGKKVSMHRLILGAPKGVDTDHRNHDGLDNRRDNLRLCTRSQNIQNQKPRNHCKSSQYKGVYRSKEYEKWQAYIKLNRVRYCLGSYADEDVAALVYNFAAIVLFGEFACLNVVKGNGNQ